MQADRRGEDFEIELADAFRQSGNGARDDGRVVIVGFCDVLELRIEEHGVVFRIGIQNGHVGGIADFRFAVLLKQSDEAGVELRSEKESADGAGRRLKSRGSARRDAERIPCRLEDVESGSVLPCKIFDAHVAECAFAHFIDLEMKVDLRCGAVEPGKKLVHEFGIGGIVFPVDLIGVLVVSVKRTVRSSVDAGVDCDVDELLT